MPLLRVAACSCNVVLGDKMRILADKVSVIYMPMVLPVSGLLSL